MPAELVARFSSLFARGQFGIVVPFDRVTGRVYLNGVGGSRGEAEAPFELGAIEMTEDEAAQLDFIEATLFVFETPAGDSDMFPCVVPVHRKTGSPLLSAIGSNEAEAEANISFSNEDVDDYALMPGGIVMPGYSPSLAPPEPQPGP